MAHRENLAHDPASLAGTTVTFPILPALLDFPPEDDDQSSAGSARRDLESALQLLAQRAQYVTGASGAAIALREGEEMICRASAGPSAPPLETPLQSDTGLTAETLRRRQVLRCDDTDNDPRVDQESCRALGVKSIMVTPLLRQQEPVGVFELLAERRYAFEDRDVDFLGHLSEMVLTALDQAEATEQDGVAAEFENSGDLQSDAKSLSADAEEILLNPPLPIDLTKEIGQIQKCSVCGFPVSASRNVCLDCEKASRATGQPSEPANGEGSGLLAELSPESHGWVASACYATAVLLFVVALVWLFFRLH